MVANVSSFQQLNTPELLIKNVYSVKNKIGKGENNQKE